MGIIVRGLWFVFIGWWLGLLWLSGSILLMLSIIGFPFGALAATKTWQIMTLKSSPKQVVVNTHAEANVQTADSE